MIIGTMRNTPDSILPSQGRFRPAAAARGELAPVSRGPGITCFGHAVAFAAVEQARARQSA